jgi:hypothetical protein
MVQLAIPVLRERLLTSDATRSRDGLVLAVDDQLVTLCPHFVDIRQFFKEHVHDLLPENYGLAEALA